MKNTRLKGAFGLLHGRYLNSLAYPEDRWMDSFVVESLQNALTLDGNPNVRPMTHHIQSNAEVDGLFDGIPYDKGDDSHQTHSTTLNKPF